MLPWSYILRTAHVATENCNASGAPVAALWNQSFLCFLRSFRRRAGDPCDMCIQLYALPLIYMPGLREMYGQILLINDTGSHSYGIGFPLTRPL